MIKRKFVEELFQRLEKLPKRTSRITAYGSDVDIDGEVLMDFYELFCENCKDCKSDIKDYENAFIQLYSWQFQCFHEGITTYYENFYGGNEKEAIASAVNLLEREGYKELAKQLNSGLDNSEDENVFENIEKWIEDNNEVIYAAYIGLLLKNKESIKNSFEFESE
jgi:hypothetical protein